MSRLAILTYSTRGLPEERAFPEWQAAMAPLFHVEPARLHGKLPRGSTKSILIGEIIANRSIFTAQHLTRDADLIAATPGPLLPQAYISAGFYGELAGRTVRVGKGTVAVTDLRHTVDVRAASSITVGLALPRSLAKQFDAEALAAPLDPARNRQLAAWIIAFHRRLPRMTEADVPALTAEIAAFLQRLCAAPPGAASPAGAEVDRDPLARAEQLIQAELGSPDLLPARLAERLGVSRSVEPELPRALRPVAGRLPDGGRPGCGCDAAGFARAGARLVVPVRPIGRGRRSHGASPVKCSGTIRAQADRLPLEHRPETGHGACRTGSRNGSAPTPTPGRSRNSPPRP